MSLELLGIGSTLFNNQITLTVVSLSNAVGAALLGQPELAEKWKTELNNRVAREGKFQKYQVAYLPIGPPPILWEYMCASCIVFDKSTKTCKWVSEWGFPNPGEISPIGWCAIWMPKPDDAPLSYSSRPLLVLTEPGPTLP